MQTSFIPSNELRFLSRTSHGGERTKGKRKVKRPLILGAITHVILKSSRATGVLSFYRHKKQVGNLIRERSRRFFIEVLDMVIMGNHIHLKVRFKDATRFRNFLRTFTGMLARALTKARKGLTAGRFWDHLAYTRVLLSKFEEWGLRHYFEGNRIEQKEGYEARVAYLKTMGAKRISIL